MDTIHQYFDRASQGKAGKAVDNFAAAAFSGLVSSVGLLLAFWNGWKETPPLFLEVAGGVVGGFLLVVTAMFFIVGCLAVGAEERREAATTQELEKTREEVERLREENARLVAERDSHSSTPHRKGL